MKRAPQRWYVRDHEGNEIGLGWLRPRSEVDKTGPLKQFRTREAAIERVLKIEEIDEEANGYVFVDLVP